MIAVVLFACVPGGAEDPGPDQPAPPFVDSLNRHAVHILATATPAPGDPGHALTELSGTLDTQWSLDLGPGEGTAGAVRYPDGDTVYVRSGLPPAFVSALERVGPEGTLIWSQDSFFTGPVSFAHGVVVTPAGDFVIPDPLVNRVFAVSEAGDLLWDMSFQQEGGGWLPNGIDLQTDADGITRIALTELTEPWSPAAERVEVYRLGGRTDLPTLEWSFSAGSRPEDRLWPHGPRFLDDGSVMVSFGATGQIARLVDGAEDWRVPKEPGTLAFPRDVVVLPDGTWLVADAAAEVLRVYDPLGRFEIVGAASVPGVFSFAPVVCGEGGGLPCL